MQASIVTLYRSSILEIKNFVCQCRECGMSAHEYQQKFSICYIRRGSFLFEVFNDDLESYTGKFLINKPGFTHRVRHYPAQPDECTVISIDTSFYNVLQDQFSTKLNGFFNDPDVHSILVNATPESEYLHYRLYANLSSGNAENLLIDTLVMDLISCLFDDRQVFGTSALSQRHKQIYLPHIEKTKEFIQENFIEDLSLEQVAAKACMSAYHFNRIFKKFTWSSPYQYLLNFRLQHAEHLLKDTDKSITLVSHLSGFNSPDHFSYAFKSKNRLSPIEYRKNHALLSLKF
ncbi:helix-turn-helix domain-containing protein [Mucilaginibacter sp. McL0603]|uniref:helix-turn-helix domain-containing protein n=1 Tax=Mucilaginibacter sp. McL0603 TaxID=3415670 RepID=UPI003CF857B1